MKLKLSVFTLCCCLIIGLFLDCSNIFGQVFVMGNSEQQCLKGDGQLQKHLVPVTPFTGVAVSGAFTVNIFSNSTLKDITVQADKNLQAFIAIKNKSGLLEITASRSICSKKPIAIDISVPSIDRLFSEGANNITLNNLLSNRLEITLDGSGTLKVIGKTGVLKAVIGGSGEFQAAELHAARVDIVANGSSEGYVCATKELKAQSNGASEIVYYGEPELLSIDEQEAGEVRVGVIDQRN